MTPERFSRLEALFAGASALPADARDEFLSHQCVDDPDLLAEARALLKADASASDPVPMVLAPEATPARLGEFRVLRVLGEGGMGVVYEAEQAKPQRRVALKVLRMAGASARLRRRFEYEAEVLARLKHTGIASVYAVGIDADRMFIAMELVEGVTLARFIQGNSTPARRKLGMFLQVCDAVHHAHLNGVIHRDLKPGNIMIDEAGNAKVLDFGIARHADPGSRTWRTETGQIIGTLSYMSPEQVTGSGEADARADLYSLGVILHELLCGTLPTRSKTARSSTRHGSSSTPSPRASGSSAASSEATSR